MPIWTYLNVIDTCVWQRGREFEFPISTYCTKKYRSRFVQLVKSYITKK